VIILPVLLAAVALPFLVLFLVVRRYEKERFWRWFVLYCICGIFGGVAVLTLGGIAYPLVGPIYNGYLALIGRIAKGMGLQSTTTIILLRITTMLSTLLLWYLGSGLAIWVVWRAHSSQRRLRSGGSIHSSREENA